MAQSSSSSSSSATVERYVSLAVSAVTSNDDGYLVTLTVVDTYGLPEELFVLQRKPDTAQGTYDEFSHVASPADIEEYPITSPLGHVPFYRLAAVSLVFRNLDLLMQSIRDVKLDIDQLVETANQLAAVSECQFVVDGDGATACLPVS